MLRVKSPKMQALDELWRSIDTNIRDRCVVTRASTVQQIFQRHEPFAAPYQFENLHEADVCENVIRAFFLSVLAPTVYLQSTCANGFTYEILHGNRILAGAKAAWAMIDDTEPLRIYKRKLITAQINLVIFSHLMDREDVITIVNWYTQE